MINKELVRAKLDEAIEMRNQLLLTNQTQDNPYLRGLCNGIELMASILECREAKPTRTDGYRKEIQDSDVKSRWNINDETEKACHLLDMYHRRSAHFNNLINNVGKSKIENDYPLTAIIKFRDSIPNCEAGDMIDDFLIFDRRFGE